GDLRTKVEDAQRLLFAAGRVAAVFQRPLGRAFADLGLRVQYGAREELLDLVRLRGIGRVRARMLYRAGFADREALRQAPLARVAHALGSPVLARSVLSQLGRREVATAEDLRLPPPPAPPPATPAGPRSKVRRLDEFPTDGTP
ncbi:SKI2-family helicase, partial [mine drainage metagenome]